MTLYDELMKLIEALDSAHAEYAVCGGLAVGIHGHPRATKDVDLLVLETELDAIKQAVRPLGFTVPALPMLFDGGTDMETLIHRVSRVVGEETLTLDLIVVRAPQKMAWDTRQIFDLGDKRICTVSREGLAQLKRMAGRPQDLADLAALGLNSQ
jgi:hypothetical protein